MSIRRRFEELEREWKEQSDRHRFSSDMEDFLNCPAKAELAKLGAAIIPLIMERYEGDRWPPWEFVLEDITGLKLNEYRDGAYNPTRARERWLRWWRTTAMEED